MTYSIKVHDDFVEDLNKLDTAIKTKTRQSGCKLINHLQVHFTPYKM